MKRELRVNVQVWRELLRVREEIQSEHECYEQERFSVTEDARQDLADQIHKRLSDVQGKLDTLHARAKADIESLLREQEALRARQERLHHEAAAGNLSPQEANERNRSLSSDLESLRTSINDLALLLRAETVKDLEDLRVIGHQPAPAKAVPTAVPFSRGQRRVLGAVAAFSLSALVLPWFAIDGQWIWVFRLGPFVRRIGGDPGLLASALWLPAVAIPLLGVACAFARGRLAGAGALAAGLIQVLITMATLPFLIVATPLILNPEEILLAFRPGAVVYLLCGLVAATYGAIALMGPRRSVLDSAKAALAIGSLILLCGAIAVGIMSARSTGSRILFQVKASETQDTIVVRCQNQGGQTMTLDPMWSAPGSDGAYGIRVYVLEHDAKDYRLIPVTPDLWATAPIPNIGQEDLVIAPLQSVELRFRFPALRALGIHPHKIRFELVDPTGKKLKAYTAELPAEPQ